MLWFPDKTQNAVYMAADLPEGGRKWWIGAQDDRGRLLAAWSGRPETPGTLAQLKFSGRVNALTDKINEKLGKGYIQKAKWVSGKSKLSADVWVDTTRKSDGPPGMSELWPLRARNIPEIGRVTLAGRVTSPTEIVRLELFFDATIEDNTIYRLDHYEHDHREVPDFPVWQTVYANADAAKEAIDAVIANRQKIGYAIQDYNLDNFPVQPLAAITSPDISRSALMWDF